MKYKEYRSLRFIDRKYSWFIITNESMYWDRRNDHITDYGYEDVLGRVFSYLKKSIDVIVTDPYGFNDYVAANLPYQQRDGRIARKELNRIVPRHRIKVEDRGTALKTLEDSVAENFGNPFESMTIRVFCKYYRIANEAFKKYLSKFDLGRRKRAIPDDTPAELRDVVYYEMYKYSRLREEYDIDSQEDFEKFATDHYGELGLSRLNIGAHDYNKRSNWVITVSNSYSAYVDVAIDVATALYKAGAPLEIYDAEKMLKILREEDYVRLQPQTFHDYMNHHEEGTVFELPWEYECGSDEDAPLTIEQYREIVKLAEWEEEKRVKVVNNV